MVLFSGRVVGQKLPLVRKIKVFLGGFERYFLSGFAILLELFLKPLGLGAEFNFASNGTILSQGRRTKTATCAQNQGFSRGF